MTRDMNSINEVRREHGQIDQRVAIGIGILLAAVVALVVVWLASREPAPEPIPEPGRPVETVEPAESPAERGDSAREIIAELSAGEPDADYAQAYERAQEFQTDGRSADAMLLYFFAARGGHAAAAFDLATFHDPNHHAETSSLMEAPDAFQAYRWYRVAEEAGHETASERLTELRTWAERAADTGDVEAERLLLQWE